MVEMWTIFLFKWTTSVDLYILKDKTGTFSANIAIVLFLVMLFCL